MTDISKNAELQQSCITTVSGSTLISDCDLSIRTKKLFENARLKTVGDIWGKKEAYKYSSNKLKNLLHWHGIIDLNDGSWKWVITFPQLGEEADKYTKTSRFVLNLEKLKQTLN